MLAEKRWRSQPASTLIGIAAHAIFLDAFGSGAVHSVFPVEGREGAHLGLELGLRYAHAGGLACELEAQLAQLQAHASIE